MHAGITRMYFGIPSLDSLEEADWDEVKKNLTHYTANITIISTIMTAVTAAFATTTPPTKFADWSREFPYCCIGLSLGSSLLSVLNGLAVFVFLKTTCHEDVKSMQQNTFKHRVTLTLLTLPLTFLATALTFGIITWIVAIWCGDILWIKLVWTITYCSAIFSVSVITFALY
ncbi:hypothetical protein EDD17DRAFT_1572513 [Pisolithus thermaeus]|nr:hypothetical protein EV401DRAFT_2003870 [Pisolithus croceorrhizus]KAI6162788.1 hypothetical protein EDD17DRAFT_1572513 [Pisolithus thermaeus]